ncbi:MAG: hypothetical protein R3F17_13925 [Planctomycetota bacterium]
MENGDRAARRLLAGLCVEQKLADKQAVKRWQDAVVQGSFDPDACADEILASAETGIASSPTLLGRAAGLERDFLMMSRQTGIRGATRAARKTGRTFMAYLVANLIAIGAYSLVVGALLILLRYHYGWSYDGFIDRMVKFFEDLL